MSTLANILQPPLRVCLGLTASINGVVGDGVAARVRVMVKVRVRVRREHLFPHTHTCMQGRVFRRRFSEDGQQPGSRASES